MRRVTTGAEPRWLGLLGGALDALPSESSASAHCRVQMRTHRAGSLHFGYSRPWAIARNIHIIYIYLHADV